MNKTSFMYKTLKNNTSQFISLAKDAGFKGTRNEGKVLFENIWKIIYTAEMISWSIPVFLKITHVTSPYL